jgi:hypothetical protein
MESDRLGEELSRHLVWKRHRLKGTYNRLMCVHAGGIKTLDPVTLVETNAWEWSALKSTPVAADLKSDSKWVLVGKRAKDSPFTSPNVQCRARVVGAILHAVRLRAIAAGTAAPFLSSVIVVATVERGYFGAISDTSEDAAATQHAVVLHIRPDGVEVRPAAVPAAVSPAAAPRGAPQLRFEAVREMRQSDADETNLTLSLGDARGTVLSLVASERAKLLETLQLAAKACGVRIPLKLGRAEDVVASQSAAPSPRTSWGRLAWETSACVRVLARAGAAPRAVRLGITEDGRHWVEHAVGAASNGAAGGASGGAADAASPRPYVLSLADLFAVRADWKPRGRARLALELADGTRRTYDAPDAATRDALAAVLLDAVRRVQPTWSGVRPLGAPVLSLLPPLVWAAEGGVGASEGAFDASESARLVPREVWASGGGADSAEATNTMAAVGAKAEESCLRSLAKLASLALIDAAAVLVAATCAGAKRESGPETDAEAASAEAASAAGAAEAAEARGGGGGGGGSCGRRSPRRAQPRQRCGARRRSVRGGANRLVARELQPAAPDASAGAHELPGTPDRAPRAIRVRRVRLADREQRRRARRARRERSRRGAHHFHLLPRGGAGRALVRLRRRRRRRRARLRLVASALAIPLAAR